MSSVSSAPVNYLEWQRLLFLFSACYVRSAAFRSWLTRLAAAEALTLGVWRQPRVKHLLVFGAWISGKAFGTYFS